MGWENAVETGYERASSVKEFLHLSDEENKTLEDVVSNYPMRIPEYYMSLIDPNDPNDPIRKMAVPTVIEGDTDGMEDTSGESENTKVTGMQHKYGQTALILSTNQCAMYCRHCFRKRMVGTDQDETIRQLDAIIDYVTEHTEINNVLISGGDSFMNRTATLRTYLERFCAIDHLDFIRFGTRIPVVLPERITKDKALLEVLAEYTKIKQIYVITQFNHPRELTKEAIESCDLLRSAGVIVRNQTVLLKEVNDDPQVLADLFNGLVKAGVMPYYIFQCRPVLGVKNQFQVPLLEGIDIIDKAKNKMSGPAKQVRFSMSHVTGKIEIIGKMSDGEVIFKYHQSKYPENVARIFTKRLTPTQAWLDDM